MRRLLPTSIELVYDNYNFFVIGYATTERASDCIVSIAAAPTGLACRFITGRHCLTPKSCFLALGSKTVSSGFRLRRP
jgi:hypothetical protein